MSDTLTSVALLIDNLKNEEVSERLRSMRALDKIAEALGERRTAAELMPFLCDCTDDEDEILLAMIEELEKFTVLVGSEDPIISVLKLLAVGDSKIVRDRAIQAMLSFKSKQQIVVITEEFLASEWYNYRTSGLELAQAYFQVVQAQDKRENLLKLIKTAASDPLPMVRRSVAENLQRFTSEFTISEMQAFCKPLLKLLADDPEDAVRAVAVRSYPAVLLQLAKLAASAPTQLSEINGVRKELYVKFMQTHCTEVSWRVRYICADVFSSVLEAYEGFAELSDVYTLPRESQDARACDEDIDPFQGNAVQEKAPSAQPNCNTVLLTNKPTLPPGADFDDAKACQVFAKLLQDAEPETRCIAVERLIRVANRVSTSAFEAAVLPVLDERVQNDDSVFVRVTLARHLSYIAQLLSREVVNKQLVAIIDKVLSDKDANVRVYLLKNLAPVTEITGLAPFGEKFQNTILVLAQDNDWRVRVQVIDSLVQIVRLIDAGEFEEKLKNLMIEYLRDPVNYVRRIAVISFVQIGKFYGVEWTRKNVIPQMQEMAKQQNYLQRNNCLFLCQQLILELGQPISAEIIPIFNQLIEDPVPNIRFMTCEIIGKVAGLMGEQAKQQLIAKVEACTNDPDKDVQNFAQIALKHCK